MIHEAYMPVYMGSRFLARTDGTGRTEVVQEALADLKRANLIIYVLQAHICKSDNLGILAEHRTSRFVLMLLRNGDLWMHHYTLTTN